MSDLPEVERYELCEDPFYHFSFDRRQFLKAFSAGIALLVPMSHLVAQEQEQQNPHHRAAALASRRLVRRGGLT